MPTYHYRCRTCGKTQARTCTPAESFDNPACTQHGEMARHVPGGVGEMIALVGQPYEAASGGAAAWEMETAYERKGNVYRQEPIRDRSGRVIGHKEIQLNPPGFKLHPKTGDVLVPSHRKDKSRYLREMGYHEIEPQRRELPEPRKAVKRDRPPPRDLRREMMR